jgi:hypothetical protein
MGSVFPYEKKVSDKLDRRRQSRILIGGSRILRDDIPVLETDVVAPERPSHVVRVPKIFVGQNAPYQGII